MKRTLLSLLPLVFALAILLPQSLTAQNENAAPAAEEDPTPRGPLPIYYGKLGLDKQQKERLYAIQDEYNAKIEAIEKQIAKLKDEQDAKMQVLLTPGQKLRLKELREAAARKAAEDEAQAADDKVELQPQ